MTERASKHARRRTSPPTDLEAVARARVRQLGAAAPSGWVPSPPPLAPPPAAPVAPRRHGLRDRLPLALRAATVEPASRAVLGIAGVLLLGLLVGVLLVWRGRPVSEPAPSLQRTRPSPSVASPTALPALVVHVTGAVRRPGLVQLPAPARVADALEAAGGPTRNAELTSVNLARPLVDGEQLVVLAKGQNPPAALPGEPRGSGTSPVSAPIDLNTATLEQLDTLPGVGPVLAQRILDWRNEHGRFGSTDELREVSGIGAATFADIAPLVRV